MLKSVIIGSGSYLPEKILTNSDLEAIVETSDEWITARTGIRQRHIAADNELTSDMAAIAAKRALDDANIPSEEIDLIIVATTTSDTVFPSTATIVQSKADLKNAAAFDVQAVCSGYIYALSIADNFIKSGQYKNIMVIGAEKMSAILDWNDRGTCILFGDGAGALILSAQQNSDRGIIGYKLHSDGNFSDLLKTSGNIGKRSHSYILMQGQEVFKHAVEKMSSSVKELMTQYNIKPSELDFIIPHQANQRIIDMVGKKLKLPTEKTITTVAKHANTSAASIPLAIDYAFKNKALQENNLVALTAIGGGLTWGSCLLKV